MHHLCIITIICTVLAAVHSGEGLDASLLAHSFQHDEASEDRPRKIAWAEEEYDKKQYAQSANQHLHSPTIQANFHMQLAAKLTQTTPLPVALTRIIAAYAPYQWANHVLNINTKPIGRIIYRTATTASSRSILEGNARTWEIENGTSVNDDSWSIPKKPKKPWQLERIPDIPSKKRICYRFSDYAIAPHEHTMAAYLTDKSMLYVWKATLPFVRAKILGQALYVSTPRNAITAITFSPCSNYLFAGSDNGKVYVFSLHTKKHVYTFKHNSSVTALACKDDGSELLVGLASGAVKVWRGTSFDISLEAQNDLVAGPEPQKFSEEEPLLLVPVAPEHIHGCALQKRFDRHRNLQISYTMECDHHSHECCWSCKCRACPLCLATIPSTLFHCCFAMTFGMALCPSACLELCGDLYECCKGGSCGECCSNCCGVRAR